MWKNKSIMAVLLASCLLLTASLSVSADSELISQDEIKADSVNYQTVRAGYGKIERLQSCGVSEYLPKTTTVLYDGKRAEFVKLVSERSGKIRKGETIAEVRILIDEVAVTEKELKLQRMKEELESGKKTRGEEIAKMMETRGSAPDDYSYRKQTVKIEIKQVELEQFEQQMNGSIADLEAELQETYADREPHFITATSDGRISEMAYYHEGDVINPGQVICDITDENLRMIRSVENEIRYGIDVTISGGRKDKNSSNSLEGHVVMSSSVIPNVHGQFTIIELKEDPETMDKVKWIFMTATAKELEMDNVLLIPNKAREMDSKSCTVTLLGTDNVLHKREVSAFQASQTDTWILDGLTEGDVLILK